MTVGTFVDLPDPERVQLDALSGLAWQSSENCSGLKRRPTQSEAGSWNDSGSPAPDAWPDGSCRGRGGASMGPARVQGFRLRAMAAAGCDAGSRPVGAAAGERR